MFNIVLDPGHGENENIGICPGYREGNRMFVLSQLLKSQLERYQNVNVTMTKHQVSDNPDLTARGATRPGANLFLSLHSNAAGSDIPNGTEIYDTVMVSKQNTQLANKLGAAIARLMGSEWRGVLHRLNDDQVTDWYGVLRVAIRNQCFSAMLVEHGFHTNPEDCTWLMNDANLAELAKLEAVTLAEWYGWQLIPETVPDVVYRVQVGAFTVLANAQKLRSRIMQELGIDAIVTPLADDGYYHVQVGAYILTQNATRQVELLKNAGFPAIIKKGF